MKDYKLIKNFNNILINESDKKEFENFLELKGIERYKRIEIALSNQATETTYKMLSDHYRYDVKLRRQIFKSLAFLEIALRAFICNRFVIDDLNKINFADKINATFKPRKLYSLRKKDKIKVSLIFNQNKSVNTLFGFLENCDMSILIDIFMLIGDSEHKLLFTVTTNLEKNLRAVKNLRNKVFHHQLIMGEVLDEVVVNEVKGNSIQLNVENLIELIPNRARGSIKQQFNECMIMDETKSATEDNLYKICKEFKVYFKEATNE